MFSLFKAVSPVKAGFEIIKQNQKLLCMTLSNYSPADFFKSEEDVKKQKSKSDKSEKADEVIKDKNILDENILKEDYERSKHLYETFSVY
jgi:hypothetical protein